MQLFSKTHVSISGQSLEIGAFRIDMRPWDRTAGEARWHFIAGSYDLLTCWPGPDGPNLSLLSCHSCRRRYISDTKGSACEICLEKRAGRPDMM